jgi:tetratricopeptide (TPR) repeat protein
MSSHLQVSIRAGVEYNTSMELREKIQLLLIILIPLAAGLIGQPLATAVQYSMAVQAVTSAQNSGDAAAEEGALAAILEYAPWRGDLWQRLGKLYLDSGQLEEAVEAFGNAAATQQLDVQGVVWLAEALLSNGSVGEPDTLLQNIASKDPSNFLQAATLLSQTHLLDTHIALLEKALAATPGDENIIYQLGVLKMVSNPGDTLIQFRSINTDPNLAGKAEYLAETISLLEAREINEDWYLMAGQALSTVGEWEAATAAFARATEVDPQDAIAWALLAEAQQQVGGKGRASLERALALDPAGEMVNGLAGLYHRRNGNTDQALVHLQKALAANPNAAVWQIAIGGTLSDAGRVEDALNAYYGAIELDRGNTQGWVALAKFSLNRNYRVEEDGLPAARQLVLLEPRNPVYLDLLGTAYLALADPDSAERFFLQALALDPEEAAILIHLGQASLYRGDLEAGFAYLRRASAAADDEQLREIAERLLNEYGAK